MMTNIIVTGAKGQLGSEIQAIAEDYSFCFDYTDIDELDITNVKSINQFINIKDYRYIINCAAYTAVDKAEEEPVIARLINYTAVKNLAEVCKKNNIRLIHVSTDYVFDGKNYKPYYEDDTVNPQSVYGKTKLEGENAVSDILEEYMIIRTSWLYSRFGHNFVKTMLRLGKDREELNVVYDQIGSPTNAADLARAILEIIKKTENNTHEFMSGIYHFSNEGVCSWYDFAKIIHRIAGIQCRVNPIESKDYPVAATRPFYSVLDKSKIKSTFDLFVPFWLDSLEKCMKLINQ